MLRVFYLFYFCTIAGFSQSNNWWIYFSDKACNQSISLSEKSLERRLSQQIPLDIYDVAICQHYIDSLKTHQISIRNYSRWLNAVSVAVDNDEILKLISNYAFVER